MKELSLKSVKHELLNDESIYMPMRIKLWTNAVEELGTLKESEVIESVLANKYRNYIKDKLKELDVKWYV